MTKRELRTISPAETEILRLVWQLGEATVQQTQEALPAHRKVAYKTVQTLLRRLEEKGYITHTIDGRTFVYDTAAPRGQVAARAVRRIVDWICNGSVEEVLVGMVDQNLIDWKQLRRLADKRGRK